MRALLYRIIIFLSVLSPLYIHAQNKTFEFVSDVCSYKALYDSKKYTPEQLQNTFELVQGYFVLHSNEELELDSNYTRIVNKLNSGKYVETPFFKSLRDSALLYIESTYQAKKIEFNARRGKTELLLKYYQEFPKVKLYSEALHNGGEQLIQAYELLTNEQMKNNGAPERLWNQYLRNSKSPNAQQLAFNQVLTYGWWNTVNHTLPHINYDGSEFEEFLKLFIKVDTIDCDEP